MNSPATSGKIFPHFFIQKAGITDDTIMTVAIADSLLNENPSSRINEALGSESPSD